MLRRGKYNAHLIHSLWCERVIVRDGGSSLLISMPTVISHLALKVSWIYHKGLLPNPQLQARPSGFAITFPLQSTRKSTNSYRISKSRIIGTFHFLFFFCQLSELMEHKQHWHLFHEFSVLNEYMVTYM